MAQDKIPAADAPIPSDLRKLRWPRSVHREATSSASAGALPFDDYDGSFSFFRALAPVVWLAIVGVSMMLMLTAVGYLSKPDLPHELAQVAAALEGARDIAAQRAALAYSGVTAAITVALAVTSFVWAVAAGRHKAPSYRRLVLDWSILAFVLAGGALLYRYVNDYQPFASSVGGELLNPRNPQLRTHTVNWIVDVPDVMLVLACVVPAVLATGASLLLQPMARVTGAKAARRHLRLLSERLTELDRLLYVGALALVFGTLQLSAALSIPLSHMPKLSDLKTRADLCKTLAPTPASSPFFTLERSTSKDASKEPQALKECRSLRHEFARVEVADSLRQLIKGVTLSLGIAFSALLTAIYIPAFIGLRFMADPLLKVIEHASRLSSDEKDSGVGNVDPINRIAALVATLSPLVASLLANAATG